MAWRPHEHLIGGELSNEVRGLVTGFLIFRGFSGPVILSLEGDFQGDIRGTAIKLFGRREGSEELALKYMEGFSARQTGRVGDITAGNGPGECLGTTYIEWHSLENGRVILELLPEQSVIVGTPRTCTSEETHELTRADERAWDFKADFAGELGEDSK